MKPKKNDVIVEVKSDSGFAPAEALIQRAIDHNVPVETMERLLAMRRELRAEQAKEAYDNAMARFQSECPTIEKTKEVKKDSQLLYKYAPIESIVNQVKDLLGRHGLSYAIQTEMTATHVKVICISKHTMGHSEVTSVDMPLANRTGIMSGPQQVAATLTFGKRYAFCNAFGIMTGDEDTDASKSTTETPGDVKNGTSHAPKPVVAPKTTTAAGNPKGTITAPQIKSIHAIATQLKLSEEALNNRTMELFGVRVSGLSKEQATGIIDKLMTAATPKVPPVETLIVEGSVTEGDIGGFPIYPEPTVDDVLDDLPADFGGNGPRSESDAARQMREGMKSVRQE